MSAETLGLGKAEPSHLGTKYVWVNLSQWTVKSVTLFCESLEVRWAVPRCPRSTSLSRWWRRPRRWKLKEDLRTFLLAPRPWSGCSMPTAKDGKQWDAVQTRDLSDCLLNAESHWKAVKRKVLGWINPHICGNACKCCTFPWASSGNIFSRSPYYLMKIKENSLEAIVLFLNFYFIGVVDLQCCISGRCTAEWSSHI